MDTIRNWLRAVIALCRVSGFSGVACDHRAAHSRGNRRNGRARSSTGRATDFHNSSSRLKGRRSAAGRPDGASRSLHCWAGQGDSNAVPLSRTPIPCSAVFLLADADRFGKIEQSGFVSLRPLECPCVYAVSSASVSRAAASQLKPRACKGPAACSRARSSRSAVMRRNA